MKNVWIKKKDKERKIVEENEVGIKYKEYKKGKY